MRCAHLLVALGCVVLCSSAQRADATAPGRCGFSNERLGSVPAPAGALTAFGPEILARRDRLLTRGRACRERHPQTVRYLRSILARLVRGAHLDGFAQRAPQLAFVLDCAIPLPIAMATSGKLMSVPRALPALADSEDAIAAVLGHELAHLHLRHVERRLRLGTTRELERMQEQEADLIGLDLAASAGYDPLAAIDHMQRTAALALALRRSGRLRAQPRDSVHGDLEARQRRLHARIRACGYRSPAQRTPVASVVKAELHAGDRVAQDRT